MVQDNDLNKTINDWLNSFEELLNERSVSEQGREFFKKGLMIGLQKGIDLGQLAGDENLEIKLNVVD